MTDDELREWRKEVSNHLYDIKSHLQHLYYAVVALLFTVGGLLWWQYFR
jgi:hypothetical protein